VAKRFAPEEQVLLTMLSSSLSVGALLGSKANAGPSATAHVFSADFYLAGCKDFIARKSNFFTGRCVGAIKVLDALNSDTKLFCPPDNADNLQRVRTIVFHIDARPERKNEDFRLLANGGYGESLAMHAMSRGPLR
jgi:hypothetical protein